MLNLNRQTQAHNYPIKFEVMAWRPDEGALRQVLDLLRRSEHPAPLEKQKLHDVGSILYILGGVFEKGKYEPMDQEKMQKAYNGVTKKKKSACAPSRNCISPPTSLFF